MAKKIIVPAEMARPVGPYSAGTAFNGLIFVSGQTGQDPSSGLLISHDVAEQARQAIRNLLCVVTAGGGDISSILKVNCYLRTMDDFQKLNAVYKEFFGDVDYPARTCVAVAELPLDARVEIEAIAFNSGTVPN
ncbi:RidA family protein [Pectobacterium actinidiae]|uniref:RidA family protein n=1 Tax=Pectobacterium actinidiae TaxID=1507808 RepID=UPI00404072D0